MGGVSEGRAGGRWGEVWVRTSGRGRWRERARRRRERLWVYERDVGAEEIQDFGW